MKNKEQMLNSIKPLKQTPMRPSSSDSSNSYTANVKKKELFGSASIQPDNNNNNNPTKQTTSTVNATISTMNEGEVVNI